MAFDQNFIEKVLDSTNLAELIGQNVQLKEKGGRLWGCCPFPDHNEKTASFSVNPDKGLYYCFGCKRGGNAFQFLQTYNGYSFPEAVESLAKRASIEIPQTFSKRPARAPTTPGSVSDRDTLLKINKLAAVHFHHRLLEQPNSSPVKQYIARRKISEDIIEKFRLGLDDGWQDLTNHLQSRNVSSVDAEALYLVATPKNSTNKFYDVFHDRLIFPIFSPVGDVIGFGGRIIDQGEPKYLNSRETPVFHKGSHLYGLHETAKFIRSEQNAILVEGYMDALALYSAGIRNVAAILGTALTPEHAKLVKKYTPHVTMLLDGDEAGLAAAEKSLPILLEAGLMPKACPLPDGMDPDDFIKNRSAEELKTMIQSAQDLFLWVLSRWMREFFGEASDKIKILQRAAPILALVAQGQLRDLYILELSRRLDLEMDWVRKSLREILSKLEAKKREYSPKQPANVSVEKEPQNDRSPKPVDEERDLISLEKAPKDELGVLALALVSEQYLIETISQDMGQYFSHDGARRILDTVSARYRQDTKTFAKLAAWATIMIENSGRLTSAMESILNLADLKPDADPDSLYRGLMNDYQKTVKRRYLKNQASFLVNQIRAETTPEQLEQFMNVQRKRLLLDKPEG